jgi:hypothetical protein
MSFFKKIFGAAENARAEISAKRAPRVSVTPLHRIAFLEHQDGPKSQLANISTSGMALLRDGLSWNPGETRKGFLIIDKEEFEVESKIRHLSGKLAGCEFLGAENVALKRSIEVYLRVEILALALRLVNDAYMKADPRGKTLWYTDGRQNEVYVVFDEAGVVAFHMSFLGNYVEGGRGQLPRVGELRDDTPLAPGQKGSTMIDAPRRPAGNTLNLALTFLRNVDQLPPALREELAKNLATGTA